MTRKRRGFFGTSCLRMTRKKGGRMTGQSLRMTLFCHPEGFSPKGLIKGGDSSVADATSE